MHAFKFNHEEFEQYFLDVMNGRRRHWYEEALRDFLFFISRFYRLISQFRLWLYDKRVIQYHALGCLVVSIGNLSCGGTGKTPVVEVFARNLTKRGRRVAILSRGYRSRKRPFSERLRRFFGGDVSEIPPKVVSDGNRVLLDSEHAGDEPYMLARNLPGVAVLVDKDRVKSGTFAIDHFKCDTIILDDGFQYLMLRSHINIVLVDSSNPFGNGHVLPRGTLREPIRNIRRADYIFLTKSDGSRKIRHLKRFIRRHNKRAEIIECCHSPKYLQQLFVKDAPQLPLDRLKQAKVAAISAIARPDSFEGFLSEYGAEIVAKDHYADHHRYSASEIRNFIGEAVKAGADYIVTTEKDAVRIPEIRDAALPVYFLRIQIEILSGQGSFEQCISRICFEE